MLVTIYDQSTPRFMESFIENYNRRNCIHYASEIFNDLNYTEETAINLAVKRARAVCRTLNTPAIEHFMPIYRAINDEVYVDWKLSSFAAYLALLNGNPSSPAVASFQKMLYDQKTTSFSTESVKNS